jgi:hypothetical protein
MSSHIERLMVRSHDERETGWSKTPFFSMSSLFTNNAQVFYKPHSLSFGSGGSGVRNSRHKQRKT